MTAVIDANVVLYSVLGHGPAEAADEVFARHPERTAPPALELEVVGVLTRFASTERITADEARQAWANTRNLDIEIADTLGLPEPAFEFALSLGLGAFDATYLALALTEDATLATADMRLADVAEALGITVERVE